MTSRTQNPLRSLSLARSTGSLLAVLVSVIIGAPAATADQILFVDDDAPFGGDGLTWFTAHRFLQDSLAIAADPKSDVTEIKVAQGLYKPDRNDALPGGTGDRAATFELIDRVTLLGGYAGLRAEDPGERDIELYESILTGDLLNDDTDDLENTEENVYHVVTAKGTDRTAVLDGLTIRGGRGSDADHEGFGAGLSASEGSPTVVRCRFDHNFAEVNGGAVRFESSSSPLFEDVLFEENTAGNGGGAVFVLDSTALFVSCTFVRNIGLEDGASGGGAALGHDSTMTFTGCTFDENSDLDSEGGAIDVQDCTVVLVDCCFTENEAADSAGAVYCVGDESVLVCTNCSFMFNSSSWGTVRNSAGPTNLTNCEFISNTGGAGGGYLVAENCEFFGNQGTALWAVTEGSVSDCTFTGNQAETGGAFSASAQSDVEVIDCVFDNNTAVEGGGAIRTAALNLTIVRCSFGDNSADEDGGAIIVNWGNLHLEECSFVGNAAGLSGGALALDGEGATTIVDCTFQANAADLDGGAIADLDGVLRVEACLFDGNQSSARGGAMYTNRAPLVINSVLIGNEAASDGGGIYSDGAAPTVVNCTIYGNSGSAGGGVFNSIGSLGVVNSIIYGNINGNLEDTDGGASTVTYSDIGGGYAGDGNIDADPRFVDPVNGDVRLRNGSPVIDAGDSTNVPPEVLTDFDGENRFMDDECRPDTGLAGRDQPVVDMGAFEFQRSSCDLDGDGDIDAADLILLLGAWGPCDDCGDCVADLDDDCNVDGTDLLLLLGNWG